MTEESFKESGSIEYTADVLLGLERTDHRGKTAPVRDVQLRLLKHRRGALRDPIGFTFRQDVCSFNSYTVSESAKYTTTADKDWNPWADKA